MANLRIFIQESKKILSRKSNYRFNFVSNQASFSIKQFLIRHKSILSKDMCDVEQKFASHIGNGYAIGFAAGRMAFYVALQSAGVKQGDEVLLIGFTCSVMVNAILSIGAKPIFYDVDTASFGSSLDNITHKVSVNTKVIVVQHSFGIPSDIVPIIDYAKRHNIITIEDCALSFGSMINNVAVGNFADMAIFSTDHSKPINGFAGGFLYTNNLDHYLCAKLIVHLESHDIEMRHQKTMLYRMELERLMLISPYRYKLWQLCNLIIGTFNLNMDTLQYLNAEYGFPRAKNSLYPYPANMPYFVACTISYELMRWKEEFLFRKNLFGKILKLFSSKKDLLPKAYFDKHIKIVPLRFVFISKNADAIKKAICDRLDISWFWFTEPIVCAPDLNQIGYSVGSCVTSENIGKFMVNIPCAIDKKYEDILLNLVEEIVEIA